MKKYRSFGILISFILCLCLILTTTACKKEENTSSEEYEIVYEYLEESDSDKSSENDEDSNKGDSDENDSSSENKKPAIKDKTESSDKEESKDDASKQVDSEDKSDKEDNSSNKVSSEKNSSSSKSDDTNSKQSKPENTKEDSSNNQSKNDTSKQNGSKENSNDNSAEKENSKVTDSGSKNNSSSSKETIYKSNSELSEADPPVNSIITLDIEPYAKGKYKVVNGSYLSNDSSIVYISSGKFAVRYVEKLNAWKDDVPKGSFIAHQGFNGWIDKSYIGGGTTSNGTYPSNTKEAVDHAARLGYKFVEIDITVSKDKVWVVSHDANSKELLTDISKEAKPFTSMESRLITNMKLQRKWKGGGYWEFSNKLNKEYVPTLEDVLKYAKDKNIYLILDNKSLSHHDFTDEEYDILADLINKYDMGNRCAAYAECLRPLTNRIHGLIACYSGLPNQDEETAYNIMSSYGNFMLSVSIGQYKDFLPFAKKYNVPLAVWVVDDYETADTIFADGADYVLSNYCLPSNANLSDYKNIKSFTLSDFATEKRENEATVTYETGAVNVTSASTGAAQLTLSFRDLGLKTGDIIVLSADCSIKSGSAFIKVATDNTDAVLEAKRTIKDKNTVYYVVNDDNGVSLTANLGVKNGSATFKNVKIEIMRETARGEK